MKKILWLLIISMIPLGCLAKNYSDDPDYHDSRSLGFTNEVLPLGHEQDEDVAFESHKNSNNYFIKNNR